MDKVPTPVPVLAEPEFYLIKLYAHNHESLFGEIENGYLKLNEMGQIAADEWLQSASTYSSLVIDEWIVLPNRLEGIVSIREVSVSGRYSGQSGKPRLLSSFVASYKAAAAKRINLYRNLPGGAIWQRSYQERFIPDDAVLQRVRQMLHKHPGR
jgi:REP element-mobilizing transposase RayT